MVMLVQVAMVTVVGPCGWVDNAGLDGYENKACHASGISELVSHEIY